MSKLPTFERKTEYLGPSIKRRLADTGKALLLCGSMITTTGAFASPNEISPSTSRSIVISSEVPEQSEPGPLVLQDAKTLSAASTAHASHSSHASHASHGSGSL